MASRAVPRVALLSIHPQHAAAILDGRKSVEFRKRPIGKPVDLVLLYATSPTRRIVGYFEVADQVTAAPSRIWEIHGTQGAVSRELFRDYYCGSRRAVAVLIARAVSLRTPLSLKDVGVSTPPQSYLYLSAQAQASVRITAPLASIR